MVDTLRSRPASKPRATIVTVAVCIAFVSLTGIAAGSRAGTQATIPLLRVGWDFPLSLLDQAHFSSGSVGTDLTLETLLKRGPGGKLEPNLASSWKHPYPGTFIFNLRHDVKFSDGTPFTADDVANAWNYNRYPGSQVGSNFNSVRIIKAIGQYTVLVSLRHPDATWPGVASVAASEVFEKAAQVSAGSNFGKPGYVPIGTGPWVIQSFDPISGEELTANPHWWGGKVPIQHISIKLFSDETSAGLALRAGQIDVVLNVKDPKSFASTSGFTTTNAVGCAEYWFTMNTQNGPWQDVHVRRAVAYALNRKDLMAAFGGYSSPTSTLIPAVQLRSIGAPASQVTSVLKSAPQYPNDITKAKAEMAKSAYPNGFSATFDATTFANISNVAQVAAAELQQIGITATVNTVSTGAFYGELAGPLAQRPSTIVEFGCQLSDPNTYPSLILGSKQDVVGRYNSANYTPPSVDTLISQAVAAQDPSKRLAVYGSLLNQLGNDLPYVPLFTADSSVGLSKAFKWPGYDTFWPNETWALNIKAAS